MTETAVEDIQRSEKELAARKESLVTAAVNTAIRAYDAVTRADSEEEGEFEKLPKDSKKDAEEHNGEMLNKILSCLDTVMKRFDGINSRMDALEARGDGAEAAEVMSDRKRRDAEEEEEEEGKGTPRSLKADRRDSYSDAARYDSDENRNLISQCQADADTIFSAFGENNAPRPMMNEYAHEYERRIATKLQTHSPEWRDVNLRKLDRDALGVAAAQIRKDAWAASQVNDSYPTGNLRERRRRDPISGVLIREFFGSPSAWMSTFSGGRRLARFNLGKIRGDS